MPRKPMVTRRFQSTKCEVLCMDLIGKESTTISVEVGSHFDDKAKLLKAVQKAVDSPVLKAVSIIEAVQTESLRGMTESDFLKYSVVLDDITRKPLEDVQESGDSQ